MEKENIKSREGLWQFSREIPIDNDKGKLMNDLYTFWYLDSTVIIYLFSIHKLQWKSDDDFYRLKTKWEVNALYYLPPFGDWTELATFEDNQFIKIGNGKKKIFKRISEKEVVEWNKNILKKDRSLHDYRIKTDGTIK